MMPRFFRRMWKSAPAGPRSYRPSLDALEDRAIPGVLGRAGPLVPPPLGLPVAPAAPEATNFAPARAATTAPDQAVSAPINSPAITLDLSSLLARSGGVNAALAPGLKIDIVGNSNPKLVTARLSDDDLVLTFAPGQRGTAKVTVSATDAAGAAVQVTFVITVGPAAMGP